MRPRTRPNRSPISSSSRNGSHFIKLLITLLLSSDLSVQNEGVSVVVLVHHQLVFHLEHAGDTPCIRIRNLFVHLARHISFERDTSIVNDDVDRGNGSGGISEKRTVVVEQCPIHGDSNRVICRRYRQNLNLTHHSCHAFNLANPSLGVRLGGRAGDFPAKRDGSIGLDATFEPVEDSVVGHHDQPVTNLLGDGCGYTRGTRSGGLLDLWRGLRRSLLFGHRRSVQGRYSPGQNKGNRQYDPRFHMKGSFRSEWSP